MVIYECFLFLSFVYTTAFATLTTSGSSSYAVENQEFLLSCESSITVVTYIVWMRNDQEIASMYIVSNVCQFWNTWLGSHYAYNCTDNKTFNLKIPGEMILQENGSKWQCYDKTHLTRSEKYTLTVAKLPTSDPVITGYIGIVLYSGNTITLTCTVQGGTPLATLFWTCGGSTITDIVKISTTASISEVTLNIDSRYNGQKCVCKAQHLLWTTDKTAESQPFVVHYTPIITLDTTSITVQEGDNPSGRPCSAIGNPTPTVKWYRGSSEQTSGTGTSATLVFSNIDRNQADTYQCKATATGQRNFESSKSVSVVVYYPPIVTVNLQNTTENATNVVLTCNADGFPTNCTYHGWIQYIGNTLVRSYTDFAGMLFESNRKITISKVTFKDIGRYDCVVENGMKGRQSTIPQRGSSYFDVRASAKFDPKEARKLGELHKNCTINIKFYSNPPALKKDIKWINKTSGNLLTSSDSISLKLTTTTMQTVVYGTIVTLTGQSAILTIASLKSFHLGHYQLQIENGGDLSSSFDFQFITSAPPETPSEFSLVEHGTKYVKVTWKRGFNGGHEQTFVIRYTNTVTLETTETTIRDTNQNSNYTVEIDQLKPSTNYHFWIYSTNEKGNSTLSDTLIVQTLKKPESQSGNIGAIAGGVTGTFVSLISIVVIGGVIIYRQRTGRTKNNSDRMDDGGDNKAYEDLRYGIDLSEVSTYKQMRTKDNGFTNYENDINMNEGLDETAQKFDSNTYETISIKQIAELPTEIVYVNTTIGMTDGKTQ